MILHNYDLDPECYAVRLVASCLGLPLELRSVDLFPGAEHLTPAYLALNPRGSLPILQDGALTLTRTGAILWHLATRDPARRLIPAEAPVLDWLIFAATDLALVGQARAMSMLGAPGDLAATRAGARAALRHLDDALTLGGPFVLGDAVSLADLALFPAFALSRDCNIDHDEFPALRLWARRVRRLPGFVTMPGIPDYH